MFVNQCDQYFELQSSPVVIRLCSDKSAWVSPSHWPAGFPLRFAIVKTALSSVKADSHIACRSPADKVLECVFPIWCTQCGRVWFTFAMPCPCHAPQHSTAVLCRGLDKNGMVGAWHGHGMTSVNQTRKHCINQMGKTHSEPLAARHGRGTAWARHAMCESALKLCLPLTDDDCFRALMACDSPLIVQRTLYIHKMYFIQNNILWLVCFLRLCYYWCFISVWKEVWRFTFTKNYGVREGFTTWMNHKQEI